MGFDDPTPLVSAFSSTYAEARERFRTAAADAGLSTVPFKLGAAGPEGEALTCDVVRAGPPDCRSMLVILSGTHGVEGFCGSGVQVDWLRAHAGGALALPPETGVLLVHALNPYGFAWLRRVNEDGVDLNRNFVDFDAPLPENPGYARLADALVPSSLDESTLAAADAELEAFRTGEGERALEVAVSGGQYTHPAGLFYGGTAPSWSRGLVENLVDEHRLADIRSVAVVDVHTGLGPFGYGELICDHPPDSPGAVRARRWWGASVTEPARGTSTSVPKHGLSDYGWQRMLGEAVTFIALEYGTWPVADMFRVLRADHWLHRNGEPDWTDPTTRAVKRDLRHHFYPATPDWQEMVLYRARQVLRQAIDGLVSDPGSSRSGG